MYERVNENLCDVDTGEKIEEDLYRKRKVKENEPVALKGEAFMKLSIVATKRMLKELTPTEVTMVIGLVPYVSYTDCCLRENGQGELMSAQDIARAMEMDDAKVYRLLKSLKDKGVIGEHVTGSILPGYKGRVKKIYTVNPFIYYKGKRINRFVYNFYLHSGWREAVDKE